MGKYVLQIVLKKNVYILGGRETEVLVILLKYAIHRFRSTSSLPKISLHKQGFWRQVIFFFYHCAIRIIAYDLFSDIKKKMYVLKKGHQVTSVSGDSLLFMFQLEEGFCNS